MKMRTLGRTDLKVSLVGLGTMTWGEQNTEAEAHEQMSNALERGINLFDAAEMYPVPPKPETQGLTETYIGSWFKKTGQRQRVVIATKVAGPGHAHIHSGARLTRQSVFAACEASLKRLQTEVIDLYQVHWPDRDVNSFGKLSYPYADLRPEFVPIEETLSALAELVQQGKVRHVGLSNETPWGVSEYLRLSRERSLPRVVSIQNPYSLLNRSFEVGLSEFAHREDIGLLAYSPLAMGVLSGKYLNGQLPKGSRVALYTRFRRYSGEIAAEATAAYVALAREHGLDPAQMALSYVMSRPFMTSVLIGATSLAQLKTDIDAVNVELRQPVLDGIEALHKRYTIPSP